MRRSMASVIELEIIPDLNFLLAPILAIAKIATMVGLLGTVVSMIFVFNEMGKGGSKPEDQGRDIGLALFATALGLMTAIPLVFSHVLFKAWIARFEVRMKSAAQKLLVLMQAKPVGVAQPTAPETAVTQIAISAGQRIRRPDAPLAAPGGRGGDDGSLRERGGRQQRSGQPHAGAE